MESNANAHTHSHALTQIRTNTNESQTSAEQRLHAKQRSTKSSNARQGCTKVQRQPANKRSNDPAAGASDQGGSRGCMGVEPGTKGGQERGRQPGQALEADDEQATLQGKGLSTPKEI